MSHTPRHVSEVLRHAIMGIEQNADVGPNHPDLLELKRILQQMLDTLEVEGPGVLLPPENIRNAA